VACRYLHRLVAPEILSCGSQHGQEDLSRGCRWNTPKLLGAVVSTVVIETIKAERPRRRCIRQWSGIQAKLLNAERDLASSSDHSRHDPDLDLRMTVTAILVLGGLRLSKVR